MQDKVIVLDSSVIVPFFFPERYSSWAESIVKKAETLCTVDVDIAYAEVINVA